MISLKLVVDRLVSKVGERWLFFLAALVVVVVAVFVVRGFATKAPAAAVEGAGVVAGPDDEGEDA